MIRRVASSTQSAWAGTESLLGRILARAHRRCARTPFPPPPARRGDPVRPSHIGRSQPLRLRRTVRASEDSKRTLHPARRSRPALAQPVAPPDNGADPVCGFVARAKRALPDGSGDLWLEPLVALYLNRRLRSQGVWSKGELCGIEGISQCLLPMEKRTGEPASQRTKRNSAKDYKGLNFITPNDGHARGIWFH